MFDFRRVKLYKLIFLCSVLMAGYAFALDCSGTIYFEMPADWTTVYARVGSGNGAGGSGSYTDLTSYCSNGSCEIPASAIGTNRVSSFWLTNTTNTSGNTNRYWVDKTYYNRNTRDDADSLSCSDFNGTSSLYIYEGMSGYTEISNAKPGVSSSSTITSSSSGVAPKVSGTFYLLIPETSGWMTGTPMLSVDGGKTGSRLSAESNLCGWFSIKLTNFSSNNVIIYRSNDKTDQIGVNGLGETESSATVIPLSTLFDSLDTKELYFIPDASKRASGTTGFYANDPGVTGVCEYTIAAYIYDSDQEVNNLFSSSGNLNGDNWALASYCRGIMHDLVQDTLDENNKMIMKVSEHSKGCFNNDTALFNRLFNYRPGINEVSCYEMKLTRDTLGSWTFNAEDKQYNKDYFKGAASDQGPEAKGGFYPVDVEKVASTALAEEGYSTNLLLIDGQEQEPCEQCRTKRVANGQVPVLGPAQTYVNQGYTDYDKLCNGPEIGGWKGGIDCNEHNLGGDLGRWGTATWTTSKQWKRNQQYCFESHATFVYDSTQAFTFRGDDDIWVFIAGRLAVDNGGAHWSSPGYVELKSFVDKEQNPLVQGKTYPIDIFFCDRMTSMTNVFIRTNMYITQQSSVEFNAGAVDEETEFVDYEICYEQLRGSSENTCGTSLSTKIDTVRFCGQDVHDSLGLNITYTITTRAGEFVDSLNAAKVWYGGIDLSDTSYYHPSINTDIISGLPAGSYRLWIDVNGKKTYMNFRVSGNTVIDVINQDAKYNGNAIAKYPKGTTWTFVGEASAGTLVPVYVSKVSGSTLDLEGAIGESYRIYYNSDFNGAIYTDKEGKNIISGKTSLTIDSTGIDTLWVTVPLNSMQSAADTVYLSVSSLTAKIIFYAPILAFAKDLEYNADGLVKNYTIVTGDPDSLNGIPYANWIGSDVALSLLALNAKDSTVCSACSFELYVSQKSAGLSIQIGDFKNGVSTITVLSTVEYEDSTATIRIASSANASQIAASYSNMRFRTPPVPYPTVAELYDVSGGARILEIPSPYHESNTIYRDGIADSLRIIFDRALVEDSLPKLICINWDDSKEFTFDGAARFSGLGKLLSKDSSVTCSDTIGYSAITKAYEARSKDSILSFGRLKLSKNVKTAGIGSVRSFMSFDNYGQKTLQSFDKGTTEKIAPVILKAYYKMDPESRAYNYINMKFSEPVKAADSANLKMLFSYYMQSATSYSESKRYDTPEADTKAELLEDSASVYYRHTDGSNVRKTPLVGDYVRFAAGVISDTLGNFPTDYSADNPSPWALITGDVEVSVKVKTRKFAEVSANDSILQRRLLDKDAFTVVRFDVNDSISLVGDIDSLKGTIGQWINVDIPEIYSKYKALVDTVTAEDLHIFYSATYFTNIGNFVASESKMISCTDESIFEQNNDCTNTASNFYIGWNGISNDGRLIGSGVYIGRFSWYVQIGNYAKRSDQINTFGFRRIK